MKKILLGMAMAIMATTFCACSSADDNQVTVPVVPVVADGFTWKENAETTIHTAVTATFSTQYKTLIAKDASDATLFEINLSGTVPATYPIGTGNYLTYTTTPYFTASSGNVIVTANAAGKVSGSFQVTGNAAGITAISGTFKNITVVP